MSEITLREHMALEFAKAMIQQTFRTDNAAVPVYLTSHEKDREKLICVAVELADALIDACKD